MIAFVLALAAVASPLREPGPLSPRTTSYRIAVKLDATQHTLDGRETITWRNDGGAPTRELWFHLYLNAFKNQTTAMMRPPEYGVRGRKSAPDHWGAIDARDLECGGKALVLEPLQDGTVARVALPRAVAPGETLECELTFHAQLPELIARAGYSGDFHMVTQWFPKLGVWDGRAGKCHVYCAACEFFADFGVYDVEITVPKAYVVGATGLLVRSDERGAERTDVYHAEDVHDFAWAASPAFRERTEVMDVRPGMPGVTVRLLYQPEHDWFAAEHLRLLGVTLRDYGDWFGVYPWSTLTAIDPPDDATEAAMEYPTLVGIETPVSPVVPRGYAQYVTIHELGHNWFQGLLASNEAEEPWLDEGLNEYASEVVMERSTGGGIAPVLPPWVTERQGWLGSDDGYDTLGKPSWAYPTHYAFEAASYMNTTTLMYSLERAYGRDRLLSALGLYARRYRFRHPTTLGCVATLSEGLGEDLKPLVQQLVDGAIWDFEVTGVDSRKDGELWQSEVIVHRKGTLVHAIDVLVSFEGGAQVREHWDGGDRWRRFEYRRKERVRSAVVDPADAWLLDVDRLNNGRFARPHGFPAWRTSSGVAFWLQSIWQVVGL